MKKEQIPRVAENPNIKPKSYIGIDPGKNGCIAFLFENGETSCCDMPAFDDGKVDTYELLQFISLNKDSSFCALEKAQTMPGQGIVSAFNYGEGYGSVKSVLNFLYIPYIEVHPRKWKNRLGLTNDKMESIRKCVEVFGYDQNIFYTKRGRLLDGRAEALLLAYYAKLVSEGK